MILLTSLSPSILPSVSSSFGACVAQLKHEHDVRTCMAQAQYGHSTDTLYGFSYDRLITCTILNLLFFYFFSLGDELK